jgi:hypothetical protein
MSLRFVILAPLGGLNWVTLLVPVLELRASACLMHRWCATATVVRFGRPGEVGLSELGTEHGPSHYTMPTVWLHLHRRREDTLCSAQAGSRFRLDGGYTRVGNRISGRDEGRVLGCPSWFERENSQYLSSLLS